MSCSALKRIRRLRSLSGRSLDLVATVAAVIAEGKPRHWHQEFVGFLRRIDIEVPRQLDLHLIVDNYCTHKHAKVKAWLAQR